MNPDVLATLRYLAGAGDRDGKLITPAGDIQDLIAELDRLAATLRRVAPICDLAIRIGCHWQDQAGVNGALLDELAQLVTEPADTVAARMRELRGAAAVSALGSQVEALKSERDRLRNALHDALAEIDVLRKRP